MSLLSEAMLGVTGVIRPRPDDETVARATELIETLKGRVKRWIQSQEQKPWAPPPTHKPEALRERLSVTPDEPEGVATIGDDALAAEWTMELVDARESLVAAWPGIPMRGGLAEVEPPLSFDRAQDWLSLVAVIEDPARLVFELESGALIPQQLAIFEANYPELLATLAEETIICLADLALKKRELSPQKEQTVRLFLGTPAEQPIIIAEPPQPDAPSPSTAKPKTELDTVAQRAST